MSVKHPTRLYFDPDLWHWLTAEAMRRRLSVSSLANQLVADEKDRRSAAPAVSQC